LLSPEISFSVCSSTGFFFNLTQCGLCGEMPFFLLLGSLARLFLGCRQRLFSLPDLLFFGFALGFGGFD